MSHHPPIEPFTPSPEAQVPHPVLQAALDNLDVRLEEELTRFRRRRRAEPDKRRVDPTALRASIRRPEVRPEVQLPHETPWAKKSDAPAAIGAVAAVPKPPTVASVPQPFPGVAAPRSPGAIPSAVPSAVPNAVPNHSVSGVASSEIAFSEAITGVPDEAATIAPDQLSQPAGIASYAQQTDLSAFEPDTAIQKFVHQPGVDVPEDYLESSEELLRSIAEEIPERRAHEGNLLDTLLTPLGVGSMLLLLLSSATLGYVVMNPSSLSFLSASHSQPTNSSPSTSEQAKVTVPTTPITNAPPSLDLAADEFHDVNLNTLSTLPKDGPSPSPLASPSAKPEAQSKTATAPSAAKASTSQSASSVDRATVATASQSAPAIVQQNELPAVPVESKPPVAPEPAAPEPAAPEPAAPEPASAAPAAAPEPASSAPESKAPVATADPSPAPAQPHYYVVADYSGDPSLAHARAAVPDAYVQNLPSGGAKIKLGAFSSEARAQEQIQELQRQGIPAQIYHP